jgi:hypothetical protein
MLQPTECSVVAHQTQMVLVLVLVPVVAVVVSEE